MQGFYIVARVNSVGQLEPAETPRTFNTYRQARAVAYKLAELSGQEFVVLQAVFAAIPSKVTGVYMEAN